MSTTESIPTQRAGGPGPDTPLELERRDWKSTLTRTIKEIRDDRVPFSAATPAYYFFLAIFPALIALVGVLGVFDIRAADLISSLRSSLPAVAVVAAQAGTAAVGADVAQLGAKDLGDVLGGLHIPWGVIQLGMAVP